MKVSPATYVVRETPLNDKNISDVVACPVVANYVSNTWGKYGLVRSMSSYARVTIELQADVELKDIIVVAMPKITREGHFTCAGEKKTVKKPSQTSRGIPVGPKIGFKPHKEYRPVLKNSTASSSDNKKKVWKLLLSSGTTLIIEKIGKFEDLLTSRQAILVDKVGNPLKKVEFPGEYDSEDEVASVDNDMAHFMAYERDLSHELHAICDNLDIRVRGRKKK
nr:hypothetical protein [Tanacetum cinerariifolium]